jgi:DNA-binding GntR family transcriptional regulator
MIDTMPLYQSQYSLIMIDKAIANRSRCIAAARSNQHPLRPLGHPASAPFCINIPIAASCEFFVYATVPAMLVPLELRLGTRVPERSITEGIYLEVRFAVLKGTYLPGQILDREELCDVYGCKSAIVVDALNVLVFEGYLEIPRRGVFGVRHWKATEIEDLFDIRSSMMGMASARAAERSSEQDRGSMARLFEQSPPFSFSTAVGTESFIQTCVELQGTIVRMAKVATINEMARNVAPNALFRKAVWRLGVPELAILWKQLAQTCEAILQRKPEAAQKAMNDFVAKLGAAVLADLEEVAGRHYPEFPEIRRISCQVTARDCTFGAGGREPGLDGRIIPFGVAQSRY